MWTCPSCGLEGIDGSLSQCPACAFSNKIYPKLMGNAGEMVLRTRLVLGSRNLRSVAGDESIFAAERQFEVCPNGEEWRIRAFPRTRNTTLLNDKEMPTTWVSLQEGDTLCIASRRDVSVRKAVLTVTLIA